MSLLHGHQRQRASRRPRAERPRDRRLRRARARRSARSSTPPSVQEIVFTRNATESINLVAYAFVRPTLAPGDEVLITAMEHHSNIVPWQLICEERGAHLRVAPIDDRGALILEELDRLIGPRTKIVSIAHMSNALGTINPVEEIVGAGARARRAGPHRRLAGRVPHAGRRAGDRLRFLRRHRAQAVRPDRHRRAGRQGRAARGDAAVPRRRRHDPQRHVRAIDLERPAVQVRGRHAEHRRRDRARRGDRLHPERRARGDRRARAASCCATAPRCSRRFRASASSGRRRTSRASCRS